MSHRYIRLMNNCNCQNTYRSYNRANSGGDTLIFNFNSCCNNVPMAHCGGFNNFWGNLGGFWGGVGAGLGFGAIGLGMQWLTGGIVNLCTTGSWGHPLQNLYGGTMGNPYGNYNNSWGNPWGYQPTGRGGNDGSVDNDRTTVGDRTSTTSQTSSSTGQNTSATGSTSTTSQTQLTGNQTPAASNEDGVTVDGKTISNAADIANLTSEQINSLDKTQLGILYRILGVTTGNPDNKSISLPKDLNADNLKAVKALSDALDLNVTVAHNPNAKDQWVSGKLGDIVENNGKLSYTIDCKGVGKYGLKYDVVQKDSAKNTYTVSLSGSNGQTKTAVTNNGTCVTITPKDYDYNSLGYLYNDKGILATEKEQN